jgi:hypothetical protein
MNELQLYRQTEPSAERGYKIRPSTSAPTTRATPRSTRSRASASATTTRRSSRLICEVTEGRPAEPDLAFGHAVTTVVDAVEKSAKQRRWAHLTRSEAANAERGSAAEAIDLDAFSGARSTQVRIRQGKIKRPVIPPGAVRVPFRGQRGVYA